MINILLMKMSLTSIVSWGGPDNRVIPQMWLSRYLREQSQGYSFSRMFSPPITRVELPLNPHSGKSSNMERGLGKVSKKILRGSLSFSPNSCKGLLIFCIKNSSLENVKFLFQPLAANSVNFFLKTFPHMLLMLIWLLLKWKDHSLTPDQCLIRGCWNQELLLLLLLLLNQGRWLVTLLLRLLQ